MVGRAGKGGGCLTTLSARSVIVRSRAALFSFSAALSARRSFISAERPLTASLLAAKPSLTRMLIRA